jgi:hypothetical protein
MLRTWNASRAKAPRRWRSRSSGASRQQFVEQAHRMRLRRGDGMRRSIARVSRRLKAAGSSTSGRARNNLDRAGEKYRKSTSAFYGDAIRAVPSASVRKPKKKAGRTWWIENVPSSVGHRCVRASAPKKKAVRPLLKNIQYPTRNSQSRRERAGRIAGFPAYHSLNSHTSSLDVPCWILDIQSPGIGDWPAA